MTTPLAMERPPGKACRTPVRVCRTTRQRWPAVLPVNVFQTAEVLIEANTQRDATRSIKTQQIEDLAVLEGFGFERFHTLEHAPGQIQVLVLDGFHLGGGLHFEDGAFFEA